MDVSSIMTNILSWKVYPSTSYDDMQKWRREQEKLGKGLEGVGICSVLGWKDKQTKELCARKTFAVCKNRQKIKNTITQFGFCVKRWREAQTGHGNDSICADDNNNETLHQILRWNKKRHDGLNCLQRSVVTFCLNYDISFVHQQKTSRNWAASDFQIREPSNRVFDTDWRGDKFHTTEKINTSFSLALIGSGYSLSTMKKRTVYSFDWSI